MRVYKRIGLLGYFQGFEGTQIPWEMCPAACCAAGWRAVQNVHGSKLVLSYLLDEQQMPLRFARPVSTFHFFNLS